MGLALIDRELQPAGGVDGLVEHLRTSRNLSDSSVEELASRFGLRREFVQDVLDALYAPKEATPTIDLFWKAVGRASTQAWMSVKSLWMRATDNPMVFVVSTGVIGYVLAYYIQLAVSQGNFVGLAPVVGQIPIAVFLLHQFCFARHGMLRYPIFAACAVSVATFLIIIPQPEVVRGLGGRQMSAVAALLTGALYGVMGSVAALGGGYVRLRRRERSILSLSRQEVLDRLFILKEQLVKVQSNLERPARKTNWLGIVPNDPKWPLVALMGGFVFGILRVLVIGGYQHVFGSATRDPVYGTFQVFSMIVTAAAFLGIGYLSGGMLKAIASQFIAMAGLIFAYFFKLGGFGPTYALSQLQFEPLLATSAVLILSGTLSGVGAKIEEAARLERRRDREDPASMIAEMILLERRLNANSAARCVLCVDVVRSTAMKVDQDPLVVEWSFREHQKMIKESAEQGGGFVLSTSGDGAVVTFEDCAFALRTAKDIQTRLGWFNMRVNRLDSPFRVRIGVHTDAVQGDLNDVQFTEVIDIAAHVQAHAPAGGILVTESVASQLPDEALSELKDPVEGRKVFLIVNPTLGA